MEPTTDMGRAILALTAKKVVYDQYWQYYNGTQPLVYSSARLREVFAGLNARFTQNWCAVVVDSTLDRLDLRTPVIVGKKAATDALAKLWEDSGLRGDEHSIHEDLCVTGEAFVIAWRNEKGEMEGFYNDARMVHVEYDPDNPRRKVFAAKWWVDMEKRVRLTMYYPDRIEYYLSSSEYVPGSPLTEKTFQPLEDTPVAENVEGIIPVFHFRSTPRFPRSQMLNVVELQDAINKLLADMMVAAEYGAFKQRWVISQTGIDGLRNSPNEIWDIPAGEAGMQQTSVGEFAPTDLANYLKSISDLASTIGIISRTPKHYFYGQGGDPSGEALIAMEAPLSRKVKRLQATLEPVWREIVSFLSDDDTEEVFIGYEPAETIQPLTQAQIFVMQRQAGLPLATVLKEDGWTQEDIEEVTDDASLLVPPGDKKTLMEAAMMAQQLGIVSKATQAAEFGYSWDEEQALLEEEPAGAAEKLLTAFDRGATVPVEEAAPDATL